MGCLLMRKIHDLTEETAPKNDSVTKQEKKKAQEIDDEHGGKDDAERRTHPGAEKATEAEERWQNERQGLIEQLQRLQAEFQNYQRRVEKESLEQCVWARGELARKLLPVLDNLELALTNATPDERDGFYKGVELIAAQLLQLFEEEGVKPLHPENEQFDPKLHEAMLTEQRDGVEKGRVIEVLQKGYALNGRVLRTAKVKVAK